MVTQSTRKIVQWQDLEVISEVDLVLKISQENGWKDCEIFGYGEMIAQPQESTGWKLIPADLYEYSIPAQGVDRILKIVNAGVRIHGVIIADDQRRTDPRARPAKPGASLPPAGKFLTRAGEALRHQLPTVAAFVGKLLLGLAIAALVIFILIKVPWLIIGLAFLLMVSTSHDPKLIILVDDGNGGKTWISVLTWFD
jgi:hypothetical protein